MNAIDYSVIHNKLKVFSHQIYECQKGVRNMALCTLTDDCREYVEKKLSAMQLDFFISYINKYRFNVFFGEQTCVNVVKKFCNKPLNMLTPEEDFMLGAILGYSICEQCKRYNNMKGKTDFK